jgi:hypothetical protein
VDDATPEVTKETQIRSPIPAPSPATPAPSRVERELVVVLVLFGLTAALIALGWFTLT